MTLAGTVYKNKLRMDAYWPTHVEKNEVLKKILPPALLLGYAFDCLEGFWLIVEVESIFC